MKTKRRRIFLTVLGLVLFSPVLWGITLHYCTKWAVAAYKRQLIATGEELTIDEVLPGPIPAEQNSAAVLLEADALLRPRVGLLESNPPPAMRIVFPGRAMIGWAQPDIQDGRGHTNTWEEAEAALAQSRIGLERLREIIVRPALDFGLDYHQGSLMLQPHLLKLKQSAQLLCAAAVTDLRRRNVAAAVTEVRTMLALVKGGENEPSAIAQLLRIAIVHIAFAATWELLQSHELTDIQLEALQRDWSGLELVQAAERALIMERAISQMEIATARNSSCDLRGINTLSPPPSVTASDSWLGQIGYSFRAVWRGAKMRVKDAAWRYLWSYSDERTSLQVYQALLCAVRRARTDRCFGDAFRDQQAELAATGIQEAAYDLDRHDDIANLPFRRLFSQSALALKRFSSRVATAEVAREMVVAAVALERYSLRHGRHAEDLRLLMPEFFACIPRDRVDGQPLRYRANEDGTFLLYSVGEDGLDGGGDADSSLATPSHSWVKGRDWVWPQPATTAEVQAVLDRSGVRR